MKVFNRSQEDKKIEGCPSPRAGYSNVLVSGKEKKSFIITVPIGESIRERISTAAKKLKVVIISYSILGDKK